MELTYDRELLIVSWKNNKKNVLSKIYQESFNQIYRYIYFRVYNEDDAKDVTEEVYMKLIKQLDRYDGQESISSWLYQIARSQIANHWQSKYKIDNGFLDELFVMEDKLDDVSNAEEKVTKVFEFLPDNYKKVLDLRFLKGYTLEECAKEMNVTITNVKVMQHRALKKAGEVQI